MSPWRRFRRLDDRDRRLLAEAAALVWMAWIGLRLLPFLTIRALLDRYAIRFIAPRDAIPPPAERAAWAVNAAADRSPVMMTCLVRAVAADAMLRRHGYASELHIGVRRAGHQSRAALESHAWVECNNRIVIGALDDLADYAIMAPQRQSS